MMLNFLLTRLLAALTLAVFALAACTPAYVNTEDFGKPATSTEIAAHYAGKSIRYANQPNQPVNVEAYLGRDGTYKMVVLDADYFSVGTWRTHDGLGLSQFLIQTTDYWFEDGKVGRAARNYGFVVYIQPDGTAYVDLIGGGNFTQPKPTPGFQAEKRFNALARRAGL